MSEWLDNDYEVPASGGGAYTKFQDGANKLRVLSRPVTGWVRWEDNKPIRTKAMPTAGEDIKHFWAFQVWNYSLNELQICEITQVTVMNAIKQITTNPAWGNPEGYDLIIVRSGQKLDTKYTVQPEPPTPTPQEALQAHLEAAVDINKLFLGLDPFEK